MAENRTPYRVSIGGLEHTMLLTKQAAAEMYGDLARPVDAARPKKATATKPEAKQSPAPRNKARTASDK